MKTRCTEDKLERWRVLLQCVTGLHWIPASVFLRLKEKKGTPDSGMLVGAGNRQVHFP